MPCFFSIIIPTYNRANRISVAVQSVLNQTYTDFELLIIDDGSTDNTKEVIASFNDDRIVYVYQENAERSTARNNGIKQARGGFICFLDSDDYYLPNHLSVLFELINTKGEKEAMYAVGTITFDEETGIASGRPIRMTNISHPVQYIWQSFLLPDSVCIHKSVFNTHLFDPRFNIWEDTHLFLRIAAQYPFFQAPIYSAIQVIHKEGTVAQNFQKVRMETVNLYVAAINNLFSDYKEIISPYLSEKDKIDYIRRELRVFIASAYSSKQYKTVLQLHKKDFHVHKSKKIYIVDWIRLCIRYLIN